MLTILLSACRLLFVEPADDLSRAAHAGDLARVRELATHGGNVDLALHWAARGGHPAGPHRCNYQLAGRVEIVRILVEAGADVNVRDHRRASPLGASGWTPLHVALHHAQYAIAMLLLDYGADPKAKTDQGMTAADMARMGHPPAELMERFGNAASHVRR